MRFAVLATMMSTLVLGSAAGATGIGGDADPRQFIGLWEGVDPGDGSLTQRSIICDGEDVCRVLGSDSFFSLCGGEQGILEGIGTVERGVLHVPGFTLTCSDGASVSVDTTFTPDVRNGTLVEQTVSPDIAAITFHRLSLPPRARR